MLTTTKNKSKKLDDLYYNIGLPITNYFKNKY